MEDINDCVPQFGKSHYNATVLEGSPKGFSILTVTASDCDYKSAYKDISFSITGKDAGKVSDLPIPNVIMFRPHSFFLMSISHSS